MLNCLRPIWEGARAFDLSCNANLHALEVAKLTDQVAAFATQLAEARFANHKLAEEVVVCQSVNAKMHAHHVDLAMKNFKQKIQLREALEVAVDQSCRLDQGSNQVFYQQLRQSLPEKNSLSVFDIRPAYAMELSNSLLMHRDAQRPPFMTDRKEENERRLRALDYSSIREMSTLTPEQIEPMILAEQKLALLLRRERGVVSAPASNYFNKKSFHAQNRDQTSGAFATKVQVPSLYDGNVALDPLTKEQVLDFTRIVVPETHVVEVTKKKSKKGETPSSNSTYSFRHMYKANPRHAERISRHIGMLEDSRRLVSGPMQTAACSMNAQAVKALERAHKSLVRTNDALGQSQRGQYTQLSNVKHAKTLNTRISTSADGQVIDVAGPGQKLGTKRVRDPSLDPLVQKKSKTNSDQGRREDDVDHASMEDGEELDDGPMDQNRFDQPSDTEARNKLDSESEDNVWKGVSSPTRPPSRNLGLPDNERE